jgi:MFS family permease
VAGRVIKNPKAIVALLTALNFLNYLDRYVLSAVLKPLREELHLSRLVGGWLFDVFLISFFVTSPAFGYLSDRASQGGRKKLIALGVLAWSAATFASGLARGAGSLLASRAMVGVGEASCVTIAPTIIDDLAAPAQRGRWLAVFYTAIPVGSAAGFIVGGQVLSLTHEWRDAFFVAGVPGIALALACLLIAEPAPAHGRERPQFFRTLGVLAARPLYVFIVLGQCAYTFALGGFGFWAADYVASRYDVEPGQAARTFGLVTVVGGFVGTLVGGWLGDRGMKDGAADVLVARRGVGVTAVSVGLAAPLAAAAVLAPTAPSFYAVLVLCEVALFIPNGPYNLALLRSVPPELRASAMAWSVFAMHFLGDLLSPPLIGAVADHAPMQWAMLICPVGFALGALLWWYGRSQPESSTAGRTQNGSA